MYRILLILINIIYLIFLIFILIPYYLVKLIYIGSLDIINYIIKLNKKDGKFDIRYNDKSYKKYEIKGGNLDGEYLHFNSKTNSLTHKLYKDNILLKMKIETNDLIIFKLEYEKKFYYEEDIYKSKTEKKYYNIKTKTNYFYNSNKKLIKEIKKYNIKDYKYKYDKNIICQTIYYDENSKFQYIENLIIEKNFKYKQYIYAN